MKRRNRRKQKITRCARRRTAFLLGGFGVFGGMLAVLFMVLLPQKPDVGENGANPAGLLTEYMDCIAAGEYDAAYDMLVSEDSAGISREDFKKRNSAIYEGIEMEHMKVSVESRDEEESSVRYRTEFDTAAGRVEFENQAEFVRGEDGWELVWRDGLIFPDLEQKDRVRVWETPAERGEILDRNGLVLAGKGMAVSIGMVPGELGDTQGEREAAIRQAGELLGMEPEEIEKKLEAKWVREDYFVPVKTLPKVEEIRLMVPDPEESLLEEKERQERLLEISGVRGMDVEVRSYPFGEAAAHLIGYVQNVTAEDLEEHAGEGYTPDSVIGRIGLEGLFEKELRGKKGCRIYIVDANGEEKEELANRPVEHGKTVKLTIDARLQKDLYEAFREDKSCSVAMNPETGEVLALVSTPSYDTNDFIFGMSQETWTALNEDERMPLLNRFRQRFCPGSTWKPIVAAIGLDFGAIDPGEDYGNEGRSWQKDASWGAYHVTTLHAYEPVILENALMYSAFLNEGNVLRPYLRLQEEAETKYWIPEAFSPETAEQVLEGMKRVVNDPRGTGYGARREDVVLAGKTGTAEIKASQSDTGGTELGWFAVFTGEEGAERPILLVSMTEDVKQRGGSGYVLEKDRKVLENWFQEHS